MSRRLKLDPRLPYVLPLAFLACLLSCCALPAHAQSTSAPGASAQSANAPSQGKSLFKAKCAVCHGEVGAADTVIGIRMKLRDLRSRDVQKQSNAQLATILHCGKGNMPGYENRLTDFEITEIIAYLRTLRLQPQS